MIVKIDKKNNQMEIQNMSNLDESTYKTVLDNQKEIIDYFVEVNNYTKERLFMHNCNLSFCNIVPNEKLNHFLNDNETALNLYWQWNVELAKNNYPDYLLHWSRWSTKRCADLEQQLWTVAKGWKP